MGVNWHDLREQAVEIWGFQCTNCGAPASELHHCIIHARKGKYTKDENLDTIYNVSPVCHECNVSRILDNRAAHQRYWRLHVEYFGEQEMREWLALVNERYVVKFNFD